MGKIRKGVVCVFIGLCMTMQGVLGIDNVFAAEGGSAIQLDDDRTEEVFPDVNDLVLQTCLSKLRAYGIMSGFPDGKFYPEKEMTRAEIAKTLVSAKNMKEGSLLQGELPIFKDVAISYWAAPAIQTASKEGIIQGDLNGNFYPERSVTYIDMFTMVIRLLGYRPMAEALGGYPRGYLAVAKKFNFFNVLEGFDENLPVKRGVAAEIICFAMEIPLMEIIPGEAGIYRICDGKDGAPVVTLCSRYFPEKKI